MSSKALLVVFGATGNQGGSVAHTVLDDAELSQRYSVRAITRDVNNPKAQALKSKGAQVVQADLADASTLSAALQGAAFVFAITTTHPLRRGREARSRVHHLELHVAPGQDLRGETHPRRPLRRQGRDETYIRALPIKAAFFAPGSFYQNVYTHMAPRPSHTDDGTYVLAGLAKPTSTLIPMLDIAETGSWVGAILAAPDEYAGKFLAAAHALYSYEQIAHIMSSVSGKTVVYRQLPDDVVRGFLPEGFREQLFEMNLFFRDHGYYGPAMREHVEWARQQTRGPVTGLEDFLTKDGRVHGMAWEMVPSGVEG
ncbi:NAD(P)-binding protein [Pleomassaria siparia CBS 279.74]|uniref:NAD(P)-binding protein n=1 Tax=Pleomassaria siparia CBS 279.74 TaxID=1314801 RepID=A0A6G1K6G1_9PLEO|nr:NAD(P)-binding protein [Pleomassaria siparia CBS 279.74]